MSEQSLTLRIRPPNKTKDITDNFNKASKALETSQLIKDDWFTLFESVGALEIMDPKMDSGYLESGETLEDDYDVLKELSPEEAIGIMDQLLAYEMAWHAGYPLSQTLFASLYLDRLLWPKPNTADQAQFYRGQHPARGGQILHKVFRAYCIGLIKCCDNVIKKVTSEQYYEEEDFVTHTYARDLLGVVDEEKADALLQSAISFIEGNIGGWRGESGTEMQSQSVRDALVQRLAFRSKLLQASSPGCPANSLTCFWNQVSEKIPILRESHRMGHPVKDAFSIKIQRRLASTIPPRPTVEVDLEDAFAQLARTCEDIKDGLQVLDLQPPSSPANIVTFLWSFSSRKPPPTAYARALLQSILFSEKGIAGQFGAAVILSELEELVLPGDPLLELANWDVEVPTDSRHKMAQKMQQFVDRALPSYLDVWRTICQNRCRIRRTLTHVMVDFDNLQFEAESMDAELRHLTNEKPFVNPSASPEPLYSFPLSSWVYHHKLRQVEWVIQLGFEHQIYQPNEAAGMYWYLRQVCETRVQHLERIRGFVLRKLDSAKSNANKHEAFERSIQLIWFFMLEATATQKLADALSCVFAVLVRHKLLPLPSSSHSSPALRYEARMKPFYPLSLPGVVPFEDFDALVSCRSQSTITVLQSADVAAKEAKKAYASLKKLKPKETRCVGSEEAMQKNWNSSLMSCIAAGITVAALRKACDQHGPEKLKDCVKVEFVDSEERYHAWWDVPKIAAK